MDSEGRVVLPNNHGWDRNGGGLSAFAPLLVYKVQIAMHPGHLVRGEAVGTLIICGDKRRCEGRTCTRVSRQGKHLTPFSLFLASHISHLLHSVKEILSSLESQVREGNGRDIELAFF